jgi:cell division protein FtsB
MSDDRRDGFFWLVLILAGVLTVLYVQKHNLPERFLEHRYGVEQVQDAEQQCKTLEAEIDATRQRVEHLGSDPLEIEDTIRHNKDFVRQGETIYRIQRKTNAPPPPAVK